MAILNRGYRDLRAAIGKAAFYVRLYFPKFCFELSSCKVRLSDGINPNLFVSINSLVPHTHTHTHTHTQTLSLSLTLFLSLPLPLHLPLSFIGNSLSLKYFCIVIQQKKMKKFCHINTNVLNWFKLQLQFDFNFSHVYFESQIIDWRQLLRLILLREPTSSHLPPQTKTFLNKEVLFCLGRGEMNE